MNYLDAKKIKRQNSHLIGLEYSGGIIDELIIHPTKEVEFNEFISIYLESFDFEEAISNFKETDLTISVVFDKENTWESGIFFKTSLNNVKESNLNLKS